MIAAARRVAASPETTFALVGDLDDHWRLIDRWAEIERLDGDRAIVRLRGPLGLRRTVHTRVLASAAPRALDGEARIGARTLGRVRWALEPDGAGTLVTLRATVERASALDRLLLALGGRRWLRARLADALERLAAEATAAPVTMSVCRPPASPALNRSPTSPALRSTRPAPRG